MVGFTPEYLDALVESESAKRKSAWAKYANDFNSMTDEQIEDESDRMHDQLNEAEEWLEAVSAWELDGRPRKL